MHFDVNRCKLKSSKTRKTASWAVFSAEREGFEPPEPLSSTVFKTAAIDHSAISPIVLFAKSDAKERVFFFFSKLSCVFFCF